MPNHVLIQLAERRPRDARGLNQAGGLSPKLVRAVGDGVLKALAKGSERGPLAQLPSLPPKDGTGGLDDVQRELHERLKAWRKERGREEGFDAALVLNRHVLVELARLRPGDRSGLDAVPGLQLWQARRYGEGLLQLMQRFERDLQEGRIEQGSRRKRRRRGS